MIEERNLNSAETQKLLAAEEDHFFDFKSKLTFMNLGDAPDDERNLRVEVAG